MTDALFSYLPRDKILAAFEKSPGNELRSGKFDSRESSAALAANTFGYFIDRPGDLPPIPGTEAFGWPAIHVGVEECVRFPWAGGMHPWLDALVETLSHVIGIESKRYEPYRSKSEGSFSKTYWRPDWGNEMGPFERMRDRLADGSIKFERLDAVQLVKHAFGLRTEGNKRGKYAALVYLYAEPGAWPDDRPVDPTAIEVHATEARTFASEVTGAEVAFRICTFADLLDALSSSPSSGVRDHGQNIRDAFRPF